MIKKTDGDKEITTIEGRHERAYFNLDGISFTVIGNLEVAKGAIHQARLLMRKTELLNVNNHEQAWDSLRLNNGTGIKVNINHGIKRALIYNPPAPTQIEKKEPKKEPVEIKKYCPAFHTYDENDNFLGLTVCTSGKWGRPYRFIPLTTEEVYPFEYGYWNTHEGAERPNPDEYVEREIYRNPALGEVYYEIPAVHEYPAGDAWDHAHDDAGGMWTSGYIYTLRCCEATVAYSTWEVTGEAYAETVKNQWVIIENDWSSTDDSGKPKVITENYTESETLDLLYLAEGWFTLKEPGPPPDACEEHMSETVPYRESLLPPVSSIPDPHVGGNYHYSERTDKGIVSGKFFDVEYEWGSFLSETITDGSFLYNINDVHKETGYFKTVDPPLSCASTGPWAMVTTTLPENIACVFESAINVFGKKYTVKVETVSTKAGMDDGNSMRDGKLRIYLVADDIYYTLAGMLFRESSGTQETQYQYALFSNSTEQISDPNAIYNFTNTDLRYRHSLDASTIIDGAMTELYTNGEFSLVELRQEF